jgi:RNA-directed DNA polymerase
MSYFDAKVELQATDDELRVAFTKLEGFRDVCDILEVTPTHLHYILYKKKDIYSRFEIPKKGKGTREILVPCDSLLILQKKLNYIMGLIYKPKYPVHGFVKGKGIVSNAKQHLKKNYILNFDLEDFFPSINFGRVRGILKSFFGIGDNAATIIANICCYKNSLPQGSPTSPIISNMICFRLDKEMQLIAKQNSCVYTRYADDLTFSTTKKDFPKGIAYFEDGEVQLSKRIQAVVEDNSFKINRNKTRLQNRYKNLGVTGITVNEKLNVQRNYIKKIRAILRCLELNSKEDAQKIFIEKYKFRITKNPNTPDIMDVLKGMINYVGMVKGREDLIFEKLALRYNNIAESEVFKIRKAHSEMWNSFVWVVEIGYEDTTEGFCAEEQGTGFFLKDVGFITNAHVVKHYDGQIINSIYVNRSRYSDEMLPASILYMDEDRDIAILHIDDYNNSFGFGYNLDHELGQEIILLGYPNYGNGDSLYINRGQLVQFRSHFMPNTFNKETGTLGVKQERITISSRIIYGNSGGPIINMQNEVIGVAAKGFKELSPSTKDDSTAQSIMIKIKDILDMAVEIQERITDEKIKIMNQ